MAFLERLDADIAGPSEDKSDERSQRRAAVADRRRAHIDESRRSFMRLMSHELRTPLNAIIGFSEIIAHQLYGPVGEPRYVEHAGFIRESGLRLLNLVNQIMEIARLESGAADLDIRAERLDETVQDALADVAMSAQHRRVTLETTLPQGKPRVLCDPRALTTLLVKLLENAILFGPEGGVVRLRVAADARWVTFEVCDDGEGVEPEHLPRLMRPFEQGENALVRHATGAGLGLPTARLLCEAMGGGLTLASHPGQGLLATARLPAAPARPESIPGLD